jgi:hypothetical protein
MWRIPSNINHIIQSIFTDDVLLENINQTTHDIDPYMLSLVDFMKYDVGVPTHKLGGQQNIICPSNST